MMEVNLTTIDSAWADWADALKATLFPAGLSAGQSFAFGQTTLVADFVNSDPQVINAELFRIGDIIPGPGPSLVSQGSLSQAYSFFLQKLNVETLNDAKSSLRQAMCDTSNFLNMPTRLGPQVPAGMNPGGASPEVPVGPTVFRPAYVLDPGFRAKYLEWQVASVNKRITDGGVIVVRSNGTATAHHVLFDQEPQALFAQGQTSGSDLPPFLHIETSALGPHANAVAVPLVSALKEPGSNQGGYEVKVAFTGLGTFALGPGSWFSDTIPRLFADQLTPSDQARFFGSMGVLARRIYQVVLGFEPSVTLHFDDPQENVRALALVQQYQAQTIKVGPLTFDGSLFYPHSVDRSQDISIGATPSVLPTLLGVVSTDLSNHSATPYSAPL
jgi:hypothetical protein